MSKDFSWNRIGWDNHTIHRFFSKINIPKKFKDLDNCGQFKDFINSEDPSDYKHNCWIWNASTNQDGYGQFQLNGTMEGAHRIMYKFSKGKIPYNLQINHSCNNRNCVRPSHLEAGTQLENIQYMVNEDRAAKLKGVLNGRAKLTNIDVIQLRQLFETGLYTKSSLAKMFNIGWTTCNNIILRNNWKHL